MTEKITTVVAVPGALAPWWMAELSNGVGLLVGVLSVVWLLVQIFDKLRRWSSK